MAVRLQAEARQFLSSPKGLDQHQGSSTLLFNGQWRNGEGFTVSNVLETIKLICTAANYCRWSQYKHKQKCHKTIYLLYHHYNISQRASRDEAALGKQIAFKGSDNIKNNAKEDMYYVEMHNDQDQQGRFVRYATLDIGLVRDQVFLERLGHYQILNKQLSSTEIIQSTDFRLKFKEIESARFASLKQTIYKA